MPSRCLGTRFVGLDVNSYIVGIDIGGTANKFTLINATGEFLIARLVGLPSLVPEGPAVAIPAMRHAFEAAVERLLERRRLDDRPCGDRYIRGSREAALDAGEPC